MYRDFYATVAQVLPVLLLALLWESKFLEKVATEPRRPRRDDPDGGVLFWTRRRARNYSLLVATTITLDIALCLLVLVGAIPDFMLLRYLVLGLAALALGTLLTRAWIEIIKATTPLSLEHDGAQARSDRTA